MNRIEKENMWIERIDSYRLSGLSAKIWTEKNNVNIHTLKYWISRINIKKRQNNNQSQPWVEIKPIKHETKTPIKVTVNNVLIEVADNFNLQTFEEIVSVLKKYV